MKYLLLSILVLVIFVISVTLGAHNDQVVTFNYLLAKGEYRISTLLSTLFGLGFVLGWAICGLFWLRTRVALANSQRKLKRLQQQLGQAEEAIGTSAVPAVKE
ncbi:LapA family protein [Pantoea sp. 1.19]|uniref:LapA family protein n=1 Tax=Pantoea sp. 1.19 TaxID=1925589 RepID=UPI000948DC22|nr:LapA family protein [Pantoea sp. 1.19]